MKESGRNIRERILALLAQRDYRPLDNVEIAKKLSLGGAERVALRQTLRTLEHDGEIARIRKNRYILPAEADLVAGTLSIHQAGYGFLNTETQGQPDIFVAAENTGTAMHGDRVVVRISRDVVPRRGRSSADRAEGRVIRILERAHDTIVGTLQRSKNFYYVVPDDPRLVHNVYIGSANAVADGKRPQKPAPTREARNTPAVGDKVVARLLSWESRHVNPEGELIEVLGPAEAPGVDLLSIIRNYHLPTEFPKAVVDEAGRIAETVPPELISGREDLRARFVVTIDPDDARDFDDAIHVEKLGHGGWGLGVHIADVASYVTPNSALDREARRRGNSVYLPDRVIPMLPERLSNGVCSLKPEVDRLTHSVFVEFDRNGNIKGSRFARSVIRSARRLTYKQAYAILKSPPQDEVGQRLHEAWTLAALLRTKRFQRGSLDLDFPEVKVVLDSDGKPVRLERIENDESHQLIEEFMLAANEVVAAELKRYSIPTIYRVHEDPDPEKLAEYREVILSYDHRVGDLTHRGELQRFLAAIKGKPEEQALKIGLLKSLKRARYDPHPLGHYGLAKANYLHFTSPIRRYADLVVHRALADLEIRRRRDTGAVRRAGHNTESQLDMAQLTTIAEHISATERVAAEAEIEAVRMKKLEFFERQLAAREPQVFRAAVIDVRNYGLVIELPDVVLSGLVHVSSLADDFYSFDPAKRQLLGRSSRKRFKVGDDLRVFVSRVDRFKRQIDFALADERKGVNRGRKRR